MPYQTKTKTIDRKALTNALQSNLRRDTKSFATVIIIDQLGPNMLNALTRLRLYTWNAAEQKIHDLKRTMVAHSCHRHQKNV